MYEKGRVAHPYIKMNRLKGSGLGIGADALSARGHADPENEENKRLAIFHQFGPTTSTTPSSCILIVPKIFLSRMG